MPAQVRRKKGHADAPIGIGQRGEMGKRLRMRRFDRPAVGEMLGEKFLSRQVIPVVEQEETEAPGLMMIGTNGELGVEIRQGFLAAVAGDQSLGAAKARLAVS